MRPIASLALALLLSGCGYKTWWNPPFTGGFSPNKPVSAIENMGRVQGEEPSVLPLKTEAGRIWPGPLPPPLTLQDLQSTAGLTSQSEAPVLGTPLKRAGGSPYLSPNRTTGGSVAPGNAQSDIANSRPAPPLPSYAAPAVPLPARGSVGRVIETPQGPAVSLGGSPGYQTTTTPGGGQSIVVPNGNGTSTVIHPDGNIETIPMPR